MDEVQIFYNKPRIQLHENAVIEQPQDNENYNMASNDDEVVQLECSPGTQQQQEEDVEPDPKRTKRRISNMDLRGVSVPAFPYELNEPVNEEFPAEYAWGFGGLITGIGLATFLKK
jgi:hypothetical protein